MKILALIFAVGLTFFSCSPKENKVTEPSKQLEYSYIYYDFDCCIMAHLQESPLLYSSQVKDSIHTLTYIYKTDQKADTIIYVLKEIKSFDSKLVSQVEYVPADFFPMVNSTSVLIYGDAPNSKEYKVYKYASNGLTMDGCIAHFWVPEFGIILKRNTTWRGFYKLRTNNDSINRQIELLTDIIFQDQDFYRGCEFELPDEGLELEREKLIVEQEKQIIKRQNKILELQRKQNNRR